VAGDDNAVASFSVDPQQVPVGDVVDLRCRVPHPSSGTVQLLKHVYAPTFVVLTTNGMKESSISDIDRYSVRVEPYGDDDGHDVILRITGRLCRPLVHSMLNSLIFIIRLIGV